MLKNYCFTLGLTLPFFFLVYATQEKLPTNPDLWLWIGVGFGICCQLLKYGLSKD
jgi:hypothetical protein